MHIDHNHAEKTLILYIPISQNKLDLTTVELSYSVHSKWKIYNGND